MTEHSPEKGQKGKISQCRWHVGSLGNCCPLVANPGNNSQETCVLGLCPQCFPDQQSATLGNMLELQNLGIHPRHTESENLLNPMPNSDAAERLETTVLNLQPQIPTLPFPLPAKCNLISNIEQQNFLFKGSPPHASCLPRSVFGFFFNTLFFFLAAQHSLHDLSSPTRDQTQVSAVKLLNPKHWTTRELPSLGILLHQLRPQYLALRSKNN